MHALRKIIHLSLLFILFSSGLTAEAVGGTIKGNAGSTLFSESYGTFKEPWAMTFLPNGNLLVTEKPGTLFLVHLDSRSRVPVKGVPRVAYGGQGGLGDIILHPGYRENHWVYLSYAEQDRSGKRGAVVARARLSLPSADPKLEDLEIIWRQEPKVTGRGHYSHRLAFSPDGAIWVLEDKKGGRLLRLTARE